MNLILIRGLPGSGKSTLAGELVSNVVSQNTRESDRILRAIHLEADQYFIQSDGVYVWDRNKLFQAHEYCLERAYHFLKSEYTVVVSNTFTTIRELNPYFELALEYRITPTIITCDNNWGSIHDVPPYTIELMRKRFVSDLSGRLEQHEKELFERT